MDEQGKDEWGSNKDEPDPLNGKAISLENKLPYAESDDLANPEPTGPDHTDLQHSAIETNLSLIQIFLQMLKKHFCIPAEFRDMM